ncbi:MAG: hypothetical protein CL623_09925 [Arcobacter sp.]|nr:hypothetical protein [Arcobacter sp.]|tara:strand:+ start:13693 stop:15993 length:2301 start_codon:yes stop_codon:yes gene_type:complete
MNLLNNKENTILLTIRYAPIVFILLLSLSFTYYLSSQHTSNLIKEQTSIKNDYIKTNKEYIKNNIKNTINQYINDDFSRSRELLKKNLKQKINIVYTTINNIYQKNKDILPKEEIVRHIKEAIETLRFNKGQGYFFIYDLEGNNILHPTHKEREGKNFFNAQDINGTFIVQESIKIAKSKEKEGFQRWYFPESINSSNQKEKIGFIKKLESYDWFIGTGIYIKDFEELLKEKILEDLKKVKYINNEYIFVMDFDGNLLLKNNQRIKNINVFKKNNSPKTSKKFQDFIKSKNNTAFTEYYVKDKKNKDYLKISYLMKNPSLQWVFGTGFNIQKVDAIIKQEHERLVNEYNNNIKYLILVSLFITSVLLIISYFVSRIIEKKFNKYEKYIIKQERIKFESMKKELRDIFDNLPMLLFYKDIKNNILTVNKKTAQSLNRTVDELTNVTSKEIFPNDYEDYYKDDLEVINSKKAKHEFVEAYESVDGPRILNSSKIPIFDKKGNVVNIMIFSIDITDKERLEKENNKQRNILYQQSKFVTMGEMIANIAHQWKQPLSTITAAASGLKIQKEMDCLSDKQFASSLELINNSAKHLAQTIDDFRDFFKPDKTKFENVSILETIDKTLKFLEPKLKTQNIEIIKDIKNIQIQSVQNALIQVLINLINNARDELIKYDYKRLIFINAYKKNDYIFIEIKDNAKGISEDIKDKIFNAYFTTKDKKEGTGIGLYMSRDIITKLLNSEIYVENETYSYKDEKYKGAKFTIKLNIQFI